MVSKIKKIFDDTYEIAKRVQQIEQSGKEIDGRKIWGLIESKVKDIQIKELNYNESLKPIYKLMDDFLQKNNINKENEYNPKSNHFFMQLKNLVIKPESYFIIKLNRVLQLAFNMGQLSVFFQNIKKYDKNLQKQIKDIKKFVKTNKLNKLDTFISNENQKIINSFLPDTDFNFNDVDDLLKTNQKGGYKNYKEKYLKYKQKYLELKFKD